MCKLITRRTGSTMTATANGDAVVSPRRPSVPPTLANCFSHQRPRTACLGVFMITTYNAAWRERVQRRSPNVWNQVVANLPAICLVTGQVLREISFFVEEPSHYDAAQQDGARERPQ
jgi:hypothetical protein